MTLVQKFLPKVGTEDEDLGLCWQDACVYEFIAHTIDTDNDGQIDSFEPGPPKEVEQWKNKGGLESCSSDPEPAFFWHNPYIFDKKTVIDGGGVFSGATKVGEVIDVYKQWVAIKVPICGDSERSHRFVTKGPMLFYVKVVPGKKVKHELQPN